MIMDRKGIFTKFFFFINFFLIKILTITINVSIKVPINSISYYSKSLFLNYLEMKNNSFLNNNKLNCLLNSEIK